MNNTVEEIKNNVETTIKDIKDTLELFEHGNEIIKNGNPAIPPIIQNGEYTIFKVISTMHGLYAGKLTDEQLGYTGTYLKAMTASKDVMRRFKCMVLLYKLFEAHLDKEELISTMLKEMCPDDAKESKTESKEVGTAPVKPHVHVPNKYTCFCCGEHGHKKAKCPHRQERCENCHKVGHLAGLWVMGRGLLENWGRVSGVLVVLGSLGVFDVSY